tara:strand:- start:118 stop:315 length:198 start_codon:yes stop_codon:yes gene_type:complete
MLSKQCKLHLESVNQKPLEHMAVALKTAVKLQLLVPALIIHSVAPRYFTNTATNVMKDILKKREK